MENIRWDAISYYVVILFEKFAKSKGYSIEKTDCEYINKETNDLWCAWSEAFRLGCDYGEGGLDALP
jgi:hypothetical protein